jgi:hypothetical protein
MSDILSVKQNLPVGHVHGKVLLFVFIALATGSVYGCGSDSGDDSKDDAPKPIYATMVVSEASSASENAKYALETKVGCTWNTDTGRLDAELSQGEGRPALKFAVKNFQSSATTYTCKQASNNKTSATDVGGKFDTCAVSFTTPSALGVVALNSYAMHRETTQTKPFTYAGACTIQVTGVSPNLVAKIGCKDLVQVGLEGAPRNPIDAKTVATVTADVNCPL